VGGTLILVGGIVAVARVGRSEVEPASSGATGEHPHASTAEVVALPPAPTAYEPGHTPMAAVAVPPPGAAVSANLPTPLDAAADRPPPTQADLQRALRATPVTMYTTRWCPVCRRARQYFSQQGIAYRERDIDASEEAHEELVRRTGRSSVPTIEIDGVLLRPGFSEAEIERGLAASLERRLGVRGLELRRVY
jgi:glutaredoxin 3